MDTTKSEWKKDNYFVLKTVDVNPPVKLRYKWDLYYRHSDYNM